MAKTMSKGKRSQRGAAMVEAAVVMPVMVIFYGLLVFMYRAYDLKSEITAEMRYQAFDAALHQCQTTRDLTAAGSGFGSVPEYDRSLASPGVNNVLRDNGLSGQVEARGMKASFKTTAVASNSPLSQVVREQTIHAQSEVYCVPRTQGGGDYAPPARRAALAMVNRAIAPVIAKLRDIFNQKL